MEFNEEQSMKSIILSNIILSTLSLFGSLTIILFYIFRIKLRKYYVFSLVFYLSISELVFSLANLLSIYRLFDDNIYVINNENWICYTQATLITYTDFCSLLWVTMISYNIYEYLVNFSSSQLLNRKSMIWVGFTIPIIFTIISFVFNYYADEYYDAKKVALWCWINTHNKVFITTIYSIFWILTLYNAIIIFRVIFMIKKRVTLNKRLNTPEISKVNKICTRLYLYPTLSIVCYTFATIQRMFEVYYYDQQGVEKSINVQRLAVVLQLLHSFVVCSRGFFYSLIYGFDNQVKKEFWIVFRKCFKFRSKINQFL